MSLSSTYLLEYSRHVARLLCRRAHAPSSNTARHDNCEKINSWVSFGSLFGFGAPLGGPPGRRSSAINVTRFQKKIRKILVAHVLHNMQNVFNPSFVLLKAAKKCTKIQNASAWLLFCSYTFRLVSSR